MRWQQKLTKKELRHLRKEAGCRTLEQVRRTVRFQRELAFPCWECVEIGRKLGIEVELTAFHSRSENE